MLDLDPYVLPEFHASSAESRPQVYHVHSRDLAAFRLAMMNALQNPIKSYVPAHMTWEAVCGCTADLLERNWEHEWNHDRELDST